MLSVALAKCFAEYTSLQRRLKTDTPLVGRWLHTALLAPRPCGVPGAFPSGSSALSTVATGLCRFPTMVQVSVDDQFAAIRSICIQQSAKLNTSVGKGTLQAYFAMGVLAIRECARRGLGVTCSKKILNLIMKDCPVHEVKNKPCVPPPPPGSLAAASLPCRRWDVPIH